MVLILHDRPLYRRIISPIGVQIPLNNQSLGQSIPTQALGTGTPTSSQWHFPIRARQDQNDNEISRAPKLRSFRLELSTSSPASTDRLSVSCLPASTMRLTKHWSTDAESETEEAREITPKVEELESSFVRDVKRAESPRENLGTVKEKRERRPIKDALPNPQSTSKVAKGRSKTGCLTCRRRKKKCDEAKPSCLNCQKNAVTCEGYPAIGLWKGGQKRSDEIAVVRRHSVSTPRSLPFLLDGIETDLDRRFFDHFVHDLSRLLTLHDEETNPFKDLLLPMALEHKGLMHSLMALSGSHVYTRERRLDYEERFLYHYDASFVTLRADVDAAMELGNSNLSTIADHAVAESIVHCLICICRGSHGDYKTFLGIAGYFIFGEKSYNIKFQRFIGEFFAYHDISSALTSLRRRPLNFYDKEKPLLPAFPVSPSDASDNAAMVGVIDGLFTLIIQITTIRDETRQRRKAGMVPTVPSTYIAVAVEIDAGIRSWSPAEGAESYRWVAGQLYRQCTWVYLWRTIQPSEKSLKISSAVDDGLQYLRELPPKESTQSVLLLPVFILGCAAFEDRQRPDIEHAFDTLEAYSSLGNIGPARKIVRKIWELMDAGDEKSWDWETIMSEMDYDFLVT